MQLENLNSSIYHYIYNMQQYQKNDIVSVSAVAWVMWAGVFGLHIKEEAALVSEAVTLA